MDIFGYIFIAVLIVILVVLVTNRKQSRTVNNTELTEEWKGEYYSDVIAWLGAPALLRRAEDGAKGLIVYHYDDGQSDFFILDEDNYVSLVRSSVSE